MSFLHIELLTKNVGENEYNHFGAPKHGISQISCKDLKIDIFSLEGNFQES